MSGLKYWLWLTGLKGMDAVSTLTVLDHFTTPERAYYAEPEDFADLPLRQQLVRVLGDKSLDHAERVLEKCEMLGLRIMTFQDADYPNRLKQLADPPAVLYVRGRTFHFDEEAAIGVVGTREASVYGRQCAELFGMELARGGALVVSGMAEGIDSCAIRGALKGGGQVVSVLAGGVDVPFPPQHRYLYEDVAAAGALISEYPPGTPHKGHHFLARNRILSGLSLGVLAVECREHSGTMSTVNHAIEQNRDIFAVPGPILAAPMSEGPNALIRQGARLVTCAGDILEEYWDRYPLKLARSAPLTPEAAQARLDSLRRSEGEHIPAVLSEPSEPEVPKPQPLRQEVVKAVQQRERFTDDELAVIAALGTKMLTADELVELTQLPARRVLSTLTMLQIAQSVEERPGRRFASLIKLEET